MMTSSNGNIKAPRYWPFVRGIHRYLVNSPHKGQWRGALMFPLICAWMNRWVNNDEADDFRRYRAHYDVIVMKINNTLPDNQISPFEIANRRILRCPILILISISCSHYFCDTILSWPKSDEMPTWPFYCKYKGYDHWNARHNWILYTFHFIGYVKLIKFGCQQTKRFVNLVLPRNMHTSTQLSD